MLMKIIFITRSLKYLDKSQKKKKFESNRVWMRIDEFVKYRKYRKFSIFDQNISDFTNF